MGRFFLLVFLGLAAGGLGFPAWGGVYFLDLSSAANMGPKESFDQSFPDAEDPVEKNGLKDFPAGRQTFRGVPFQILDPAQNNGHSFIALRGRSKPDFPLSAELKVSRKAAFLYFLQTCHWGGTAGSIPVAHYLVAYDDGQAVTIALRVGHEFTNFWGADDTDQSYLAWWYRYKNSSMGVNLFAWKNPRPDHSIRTVTFQSLDKMPVPLLFGVTASDQEIPISAQSPKPEETSVTDTSKWISLEAPEDDVPSAIDLRFLLDAPAGKHGPVAPRGDDLFFADGTPARFWGTRLSEGCLALEPGKLGNVLDRLASEGCNLVELDLSAPATMSVVPVSQLEEQLKARGIYLCLIQAPATATPNVTPTATPVNDPALIPPELFIRGQASWNPMGRDAAAPLIFQNAPLVTQMEQGLPAALAGQRLFGQPYLAEWSEGWPQSYEAETPLLVSAVAGFQDWAGIIGGEADGMDWPDALAPGEAWDENPLLGAQWPAATLAYLRGDLKQGRIYVLPAKPGEEPDPKKEGELVLKLLAHRSGMGGLKTDPLGELKSKLRPKQSAFISDSGQINWQGNVGVVQVDAPRFQAALGFLGHRQVQSASWELETSNLFAVFSLISLTPQSTLVSNHLLLTGVARMENTGMVYNRDQTKVLSLGVAPVLMEPLEAKVTVNRLAKDSALKVRALDAFGKPMKAKVPIHWKGSNLAISWIPGALYLDIFK